MIAISWSYTVFIHKDTSEGFIANSIGGLGSIARISSSIVLAVIRSE